jgi:hypothetical protein
MWIKTFEVLAARLVCYVLNRGSGLRRWVEKDRVRVSFITGVQYEIKMVDAGRGIFFFGTQALTAEAVTSRDCHYRYPRHGNAYQNCLDRVQAQHDRRRIELERRALRRQHWIEARERERMRRIERRHRH